MAKRTLNMAPGIDFTDISKTVNLSPKVEPELVDLLNTMGDVLGLSGQREVIHELIYGFSVTRPEDYQKVLQEYRHRQELKV